MLLGLGADASAFGDSVRGVIGGRGHAVASVISGGGWFGLSFGFDPNRRNDKFKRNWLPQGQRAAAKVALAFSARAVEDATMVPHLVVIGIVVGADPGVRQPVALPAADTVEMASPATSLARVGTSRGGGLIVALLPDSTGVRLRRIVDHRMLPGRRRSSLWLSPGAMAPCSGVYLLFPGRFSGSPVMGLGPRGQGC